MEDDRVSTSVFISRAVKEHAKYNTKIKSLSAWIDIAYMNEFMDLNKEKENFKSLSQQLKASQERINLLESQTDLTQLPEEAKNWIRTVGVTRKRQYLKHALRYFNRHFNVNISMNRFKLYILEAKKAALHKKGFLHK